MSVLLEVHGMSCAHCVASITSAVSPLPGVTAVDVELEAGTVRVEGTPDVAAVSAAIEDAGYDVTTPTTTG
ncbi:heavy metal transporter [Mycobacterium sp. Root135]|uniref:cation transporter n=1 Tax=Mycobacterium sp. Root135 TaxID=1736457 RepID=UPI0006F78494|nr:cation transporter [Mycobacterium sp. Root135]KQY03307.1 heavy metal transporter [Mycobacterium sp. Root135]